MKTYDVKENEQAIQIINSIINNGGIAEIKVENKGIAVVEIKRTLRVIGNDRR